MMSYNWYEAVFTVVATSHHWIYLSYLCHIASYIDSSLFAYCKRRTIIALKYGIYFSIVGLPLPVDI